MNTLNVDLGDRSYPIHIGSGLIARPELLAPFTADRQVFVVTNSLVGPLYLEPALQTLRETGATVQAVTIEDGEAYKSLNTLAQVLDALVAERYSRDAILLALGGGVTGDLAGFAAACYQRGIDWIQVPTTLLAQVDSSVGGKTAVNHPAGKNLIGAFHQPVAVITDLDTLITLDERHYRAGLAEVIKYGLITDGAFFTWLEQNMEALLARNETALGIAIERSCAIKAQVVAEDETERGRRALLNLGHTFGHAIERAQGYGGWLHGEAVAAGMVMAATMSQKMGLIDNDALGRATRLIEAAGLPTAPPPAGGDTLLEHMQLDKKNRAGRIRLILLRAIGDAFVTGEFDDDALHATLATADDGASTANTDG
ncbi:MAG: 3-dehydroquinate synthase [Pseudomonadota bacterium]